MRQARNWTIPLSEPLLLMMRRGTVFTATTAPPCPAGLNIGLINKYYDLAKAGDALAVDHYRKLEVKADDCIKCGHCNSRCPFHADQMTRMEEIKEYFTELQ